VYAFFFADAASIKVALSLQIGKEITPGIGLCIGE